ncbi:MAG TPA: glycosyltransferase, partial [Chloroflexaceae bacterium]|nr:glycosyltransferase [Chloroflexaceae bacterium]
ARALDEATARVVAEGPFRYEREERPGLNWARNRGLAAARHPIVAYVDDDARAASGWLRGLAAAFGDPEVAAVTGLVVPAQLETPAQRRFEEYGGMGKGSLPRTFRGGALRPRDLIAAHAVGVGANMAFRREVFEHVGRFDPALDVGTPAQGAGDLDMFHRVLAAGLTLRYEPAAVVAHQHRRDLAGLRRQIFANGRSFGVYLIKIWARRTVERRAVGAFAARWAGGWVVRRCVTTSLQGPRGQAALAWAELLGLLTAPWAYYLTYHSERDRL